MNTIHTTTVPIPSFCPPEMFSGIRAVIFDMDGTLLDSMAMWRDIDEAFLTRRGLSMRSDLQQCIEGMSIAQVAEWFRTEYALPETREELVDIWNRMAQEAYRREILLKPDADRFVRTLRKAGIKTAIATSNSKPLTEASACQHETIARMDAVVTSDECGVGKPAPDVYLTAARLLGEEPAACLVFEDILPGITSGLAAGMRVCAVEDAYSAHQRSQKKEACGYLADSYAELTETFLEYLDRTGSAFCGVFADAK